MGLFTIKTIDGDKEQEGTILKLGKGKSAVPVLGIAKEHYSITHIASGLAITLGHSYLSQAKVLAQSIIDELGDGLRDNPITLSLFPESLLSYIWASWGIVKNPPNYKEWLNGPDYERIIKDSHLGERIPSWSSEEYFSDLQTSDFTVAWIPGEQNGMSGRELGCLVEGRPYDS